MASDREQLLGGRQNPLQGYGSTAEDTLGRQRETLLAQNDELEELSAGVSTVRNIAGQIHTEVNSQNVVLDGIGSSASDAKHDIASTGAKIGALGDSTYNFRMFCILLWPLVLLIVLLVEAIVHFVF